MRQARSRFLSRCGIAVVLGLVGSAHAADWSDTAISWRTGDAYREPFNAHALHKNIFALTHVSGYKYGTNFFNVDLLLSDHYDPAAQDSSAGAQEAYVIYRHTVDLGKLIGRDFGRGPVRGFGATVGFDWNTKNDVGYNSRKRMFVVGPSVMWDVPGHLTTSLLLARESNAPNGPFPPVSQVSGRYTYKTHAILAMDWGIPLGPLVLFEGFALFIDAKGRDEVGNATGAETNIDMKLMLDLGAALGKASKTVRIGVEYQYWNNKFGNTAATTKGQGYRAKTPMIRAEYHF